MHFHQQADRSIEWSAAFFERELAPRRKLRRAKDDSNPRQPMLTLVFVMLTVEMKWSDSLPPREGMRMPRCNS